MNLENVKIRFPNIYEPNKFPFGVKATALFGFAMRKDENEHLELNWRAPSRHDGHQYANFKSRFPPRVTLVDADYKTLAFYIEVCRARNISPDKIFDGVSVTAVLDMNDEYINVKEIIVDTDALNDPFKL